MTRIVAVLDIGKTNAKLVVHDLRLGRDLHAETRPNRVRSEPPFPHFDADGLFDFLVAALGRAATAFAIDAVSVTTHGASFALLDENGALALPILDYEFDGPEEVRSEYDIVRPGFAETFSPRLPNGLNAGAQLFWLETRFPEAFARARHILPYPQYWTYRLTGTMASEATSLGCHTDLWAPRNGGFSALAHDRGWAERMAPLRSAFDAAGTLRPDIAGRIGLGGRWVPVHVGIHDSNASLLPHLIAADAPLSVISTGTWVVAFATGGDLARLDPARDMLANIDAFGRPVPSARFMGGREFDILTGGQAVEPTCDDVTRVLDDAIMAFPSFAGRTGPFPEAEGFWSHDPATLTPGERTAAASLYVAAMTATMLDAMGACGRTIVEGPLASNDLFTSALRALTGRSVVASICASGTTAGAARLCLPSHEARSPTVSASPPSIFGMPELLFAYVNAWNAEHFARRVPSD